MQINLSLAAVQDLDACADAYGTDGFYLDGFDLEVGIVEVKTSDGHTVSLEVVASSINCRDAVVRIAA